MYFTRIDHFRDFSELTPNTDDFEDTEINGFEVIVQYRNEKVTSMWYKKANFGTISSVPFKSFIDYAEADTHWPYG